MPSTFSSRARASASSYRAFGTQPGAMTGAIEQGHLELSLKIADGVAHRRLNAGQPSGGGAEAAGFGDRHEHAHLIEGEAVKHVR
jgi:hypothetical protein